MNAPVRNPASNRPALITGEQLLKDFAHVDTAINEIEARGGQVPPVIEDEEDLAIAQKLVADCREQSDKTERAREAEKRPYLEAGRVIDGFFRGFSSRLDALKFQIEKRATLYLNKKAAAERAVREEQARREREEAERLAELARQAAAADSPKETTTSAMTDAVNANNRAFNSEQAAQAKPAELARTRTDAGTATLVDDWQFEIVDFDKVDLNKLRAFMSRADIEKAIRRHVGIHKDTQALDGVRIYNSPKARMV